MKKETEAIIKRCGKCEYGALELQPVHNVMTYLPTCFYWAHPGPMGGCGTEWAMSCSDFKDAGKVGYVERTVKIRREMKMVG